jgi:hypothetical protein
LLLKTNINYFRSSEGKGKNFISPYTSIDTVQELYSLTIDWNDKTYRNSSKEKHDDELEE